MYSLAGRKAVKVKEIHPLIRVRHGAREGAIGGPNVRLNRLNQFFPETRRGYSIIYSNSASVGEWECRWAKWRGIPVVCHVNSCYYPGYAVNWRKQNKPFCAIHNHVADFIVYGSEHARDAAQKFLGHTESPFEVIYNAVDLERFKRAERSVPERCNLLIAGLHYLKHRIEPVIQALPLIRSRIPEARLLIAGRFDPSLGDVDCTQEYFEKLCGNPSYVDFLGEYSQEDAPKLYAQADMLVHLKHMDWTPNVVIEAMACGLPIVHAGNGGVPEIVRDAGVSVGMAEDWDEARSADPESVAAAVLQAWRERSELSLRGRTIAMERHDLKRWVERHRLIFEKLVTDAKCPWWRKI